MHFCVLKFFVNIILVTTHQVLLNSECPGSLECDFEDDSRDNKIAIVIVTVRNTLFSMMNPIFIWIWIVVMFWEMILNLNHNVIFLNVHCWLCCSYILCFFSLFVRYQLVPCITNALHFCVAFIKNIWLYTFVLINSWINNTKSRKTYIQSNHSYAKNKSLSTLNKYSYFLWCCRIFENLHGIFLEYMNHNLLERIGLSHIILFIAIIRIVCSEMGCCMLSLLFVFWLDSISWWCRNIWKKWISPQITSDVSLISIIWKQAIWILLDFVWFINPIHCVQLLN